MADDLLVTQVRSRTTDVVGRSLNSVRTHHFVIDEPTYGGGPGEELTPGESFLAGISACGVLLVEGFARHSKIPLTRAEAEIEGRRLRSDPSRYLSVELRFRLQGPDRDQAEELVRRYQER